MRRLADLAFLFQLYEFAYQTYHTAKRDFNNDHAWLHYAGALVSVPFMMSKIKKAFLWLGNHSKNSKIIT